MANVFQEIPIEQLCSRVTTGATPLRSRSDFYEGGTTDWYKTGELKDWYLEPAEERITKKALEETSVKLFPANTVLMAMYGDGRTITSLGMLRAPATTNQACSAMLVDEEKCDTRYFFYALKGRRHLLLKVASGGAQRNLSGKLIKEFKLPVPPLPVQRRIAGILSAYDELMENSHRRIRLLEAMARALYRECIREAGESASAKGILETDCWTFISANVSPYSGTKRYYATADIEGLAIHGAGIDYTFAEKPSRAQKQPTPFSVWFARMKDTYKIAWYSDVNSQSAYSSVLSSGFAGFQPVEPLYFPLLFLTVSSKDFHAQKDLFCTGATQMSLTNEGLSRIEVPAPSKQAARQLGEQALPLLNQMLVLQLRIQNLRRTRDLLLPRLLSGRVHQIKTEP